MGLNAGQYFDRVLLPPVMGLGVHLGDHTAGGFFEQAGNDRMDQRATPGGKQFQAEFAGENHVLSIGFIDAARVVQKNAVHHGACLFREWGLRQIILIAG